jgi:hypothetical protein
VNATNAYVESSYATRALRYLVHFKAGDDDYLVVYDDMASSSGNTKSFNLYYDEDCTTFTHILPNIVCRASDRSLLTDVIYPSGSDIAKSYSSETYAEKLTLCASTNGSTCDATNTDADFLLVHMPLAAPTGSMPTVAGLGTIDANFRGVEIKDASKPGVAIFPKVGATYSDASFTTTHSGTGQYLVMGLEPALYDVMRGGQEIVNERSVDSNGTLYFESTSGAFTIGEAQGAPGPVPPPWIDPPLPPDPLQPIAGGPLTHRHLIQRRLH